MGQAMNFYIFQGFKKKIPNSSGFHLHPFNSGRPPGRNLCDYNLPQEGIVCLYDYLRAEIVFQVYSPLEFFSYTQA